MRKYKKIKTNDEGLNAKSRGRTRKEKQRKTVSEANTGK